MWLFVRSRRWPSALAALGLFSLVALDVTQRAREFAIRMALGASRQTILRGVLARAATRVAVGMVLGLGAALLSGRALRGLLFGIAPEDGPTYAAVLVVVSTAVALAAYLPARRAGRIEPQALLRM